MGALFLLLLLLRRVLVVGGGGAAIGIQAPVLVDFDMGIVAPFHDDGVVG